MLDFHSSDIAAEYRYASMEIRALANNESPTTSTKLKSFHGRVEQPNRYFWIVELRMPILISTAPFWDVFKKIVEITHDFSASTTSSSLPRQIARTTSGLDVSRTGSVKRSMKFWDQLSSAETCYVLNEIIYSDSEILPISHRSQEWPRRNKGQAMQRSLNKDSQNFGGRPTLQSRNVCQLNLASSKNPHWFVTALMRARILNPVSWSSRSMSHCVVEWRGKIDEK